MEENQKSNEEHGNKVLQLIINDKKYDYGTVNNFNRISFDC